MRFTSVLAATAILVVSTNAASLSKRAVSAQVQLCRDDITAISAQISVVTTALSGFNANQGYSGALAIHNKEQVLETALKTAGTDCCAVAGKITNEEADAMLVTITPVIPQATAGLALAEATKVEFEKIQLVTPIAKTDIKNLNNQTVILYTCIRDIGSEQHPTYIPQINDFIYQLDTAFASASLTYNITATA